MPDRPLQLPLWLRIGTAGWPLPAAAREHFPPGSSLLERYAGVFNAVEINSSFYRSHRPDTYRRWAEATPHGFAFSAKLPREITHRRKLVDCEDLVESFVRETDALGPKLGAVLVQLPPALSFDAEQVKHFFEMLRIQSRARVLCEPRHPSWFTGEADALLGELGVGRVAADPFSAPSARTPAGDRTIAYLRLHGAPRMYYSNYEADALAAIAAELTGYAEEAREVWCIFDNTAEFHATSNALDLMRLFDNAAVNAGPEPGQRN